MSSKKKPDNWWRLPDSGVDQELWPVYEDFRLFLWVVWAHLGLPVPTPIQYDIAQYLQNGPLRAIIEAFRGVGKTWVAAAYVCWRLMRAPWLNIMVVSASKQHADQFSTFTLRLIEEVPILQHLTPRDGQRNSKIAFDVAQAPASPSPSVKSVGITGQLTGSRADLILADDVEVPNNSQTQQMRDKLSELVKEFDAVLKPGGEVKYLGTPQTEQSLYPTVETRGYTARIWPARYPTQAQRDKYGRRLAPMIEKKLDAGATPGLSTDPARFTDIDLLEREASYGRAGFSLQFMLDTTLSDIDRYPLKLSDLIVMSCPQKIAPLVLEWGADPALIINNLPNVGLNGDRLYRPIFIPEAKDWTEYTGCVMAIDPSGRGKDETGYAIVKMNHGLMYLVDAGGFLGGYNDETLKAIAVAAHTYGVHRIIVEPNFGDGMFRQLLIPVVNRIHPCTVEDAERSNSQKEKRIIDTLEPVMMRHRLVVDPKLIEKDYKSTESLANEDQQRYRLFYQLTRVTRDRGALVRDDRLDALAMAVGYWVEVMGQDLEQTQEANREKMRDLEYEKFIELAGKTHKHLTTQNGRWGNTLR